MEGTGAPPVEPGPEATQKAGLGDEEHTLALVNCSACIQLCLKPGSYTWAFQLH